MLLVLIILVHRIGILVAATTATVLVLLPLIFDQEGDVEFVQRLDVIIERGVYLGLAILVVSGLLRLQYVIPSLLPLKLVMVGLTLGWVAFGRRKVDVIQFHRIQLLLILLTAITGLII